MFSVFIPWKPSSDYFETIHLDNSMEDPSESTTSHIFEPEIIPYNWKSMHIRNRKRIYNQILRNETRRMIYFSVLLFSIFPEPTLRTTASALKSLALYQNKPRFELTNQRTRMIGPFSPPISLPCVCVCFCVCVRVYVYALFVLMQCRGAGTGKS